MSRRHAQPPDDAGLPPELQAMERELARLEAPAAPADFRTLLRARFLSGDFESDAEAVLARWPAPPARDEFRAALRERFLAGARASAPVRRSRPAVPRAPARPSRRLGLLVAAAAVLLAVPFLPLGQAQPAGWHVVASPGVEAVSIDGEPVACADAARLDERLSRTDCRLESSARSVRLVRDRNLLLHVEPETRVRLSRFTDANGEGLLVRLEQGSVGVSLSPGSAPYIVVQTPQGRVEVSGRAVAVELVGGGLCICCLEGEARLVTEQGARTVSSATTLYVGGDGSQHLKSDGVAHAEPVGSLRAVADANLD